MVRWLCNTILFRLMGWKVVVTVPMGNKYVIALAPHTSNFDFLLGLLYSRAEGFRCNFLMKKEWFFWPLGRLMRRLGGIPVYRDKNTSLTDRLAQLARAKQEFHLCVTPEGTRSRTEEWKKGFYYIARKAGIPILLFGVDYPTRTIRCTRMIHPDGDIDRQMADIKTYFKDFTGRHAEKFTTGPI